MHVQHAFRVIDPPARQVFDQAVADRDAWLSEVLDLVATVHPDAKPFGSESKTTGVVTTFGIVGPDVPWEQRRQEAREAGHPGRITPNYLLDPVPDGWRWVTSRDCYRPTTKAAKEVLAAVPVSKPNPRVALVRHVGMPVDVWQGNHIYYPSVFQLGGDLWIGYGCRLDVPDDDGRGRTFMPDPMPAGVVEAKLSEFYAAQEAEEARRAAEKASA